MTIVGKLLRGAAGFIKAGVKSVIGAGKDVVSGNGPVGLQQQTATQAVTFPIWVIGAIGGVVLLFVLVFSLTSKK